MLLEYGADPNTTDRGGFSLLHFAAVEGDETMLRSEYSILFILIIIIIIIHGSCCYYSSQYMHSNNLLSSVLMKYRDALQVDIQDRDGYTPGT